MTRLKKTASAEFTNDEPRRYTRRVPASTGSLAHKRGVSRDRHPTRTPDGHVPADDARSAR